MFKRSMIAVAAAFCAIAPAAHAGTGPLVLGTAANPPMGPGPGRLFLVNPTAIRTLSFAKAGTLAGNSFFAGYDPTTHTIYVPSPVGRVTMVNAETGRRIGTFPAMAGARVARVLLHRNLVVVLSAKKLAAYALRAPHAPVFTLGFGGNALAVNRAESKLYVGGNMNRRIRIVAIPSGHVAGTYPVAGSGDLLSAGGKLFSADMKTGIMSVIDLTTGTVTRIRTPEVDPHFSYHAIPRANAGFMQLAKSPDGHKVYAAGFSGHIVEFSSRHPKFLGEIAVRPAKGPNKLSGVAIVDHGLEALVTIENRHETVLVSLRNARIVHTFKGVASNRWIAVHGG